MKAGERLDFAAELAAAAAAADGELDRLLPVVEGPEGRLFEVMRYAALGPGKRMRPFLVLNSARLFNVPSQHALRVAAAIEMVHSYSLVHDDLPAMDDDDLRRGRPTAHIQFDEATAILAGDALLTLAFEVLADPATHPNATIRAELVGELARGAGGRGMVGGQMLDLLAAHRDFDLGGIARLERLKTGALIGFSCGAGAILANANEASRAALYAYAHDLGFAFQIADDLLDAEGSEAQTGKRVGKDAAAGKATVVSLLGVEEARQHAQMLARQAVSHLDLFREMADPLRAAAHFVVDRRA
ncbi:MAG: polyprenyl synthetase family protein [Alphaproteobacteria bacterium]|nr:polyprenyl synthetase family protein [Alphaproteobacteria bacterium]